MKLKTLFAVAAATLLAGCLGDSTGSSSISIGPPAPLPAGTDTVTLASGLQYADITVGTGTVAQDGSNVSVHYTGWTGDGVGFETTAGGAPVSLTVGDPQLIAGFNEGLLGMKVGGKRRLLIPPALGYGSTEVRDRNGKVVIPANSSLIFDVQLVSVAN